MMRADSLFRRLIANRRGAAAIETAFVMPVLAVMALGSFEISMIITQRSELQGAMADVTSVALASEPTTQERRDTLRAIIQQSVGASTTVAVNETFRCGDQAQIRSDLTMCGNTRVSSYVQIALNETYTPIWSKFGVGGPLNLAVTRNVLIKQQAD